MFSAVLSLWAFLVYWTVGLAYTALDVWTPNWAERYKIQPGTNTPVDKTRLWSAVKRVLFNQLVVGTVFTFVFGFIGLRFRNMPYKVEDFPSLYQLAFQAVIIVLCEEIGFFYSHRLFHIYPSLYKRFHKIHHEWTSPIAITAVYAHPLEHALSNLGPVALGPLVSGCHVIVVFAWVAIAQFVTLGSHSGYHFPFMSSPEAHDFHHLKFNVNFGVLGILDHFYGTDDKFLKDPAFLRHQTFFSATSMRERYPDEKKQL